MLGCVWKRIQTGKPVNLARSFLLPGLLSMKILFGGFLIAVACAFLGLPGFVGFFGPILLIWGVILISQNIADVRIEEKIKD